MFFFCVIMCAYQMTRLAWVRHCFPVPLSPIGPTQPSWGHVTRRIDRWAFQDGHLVSIFFMLIFFFFYIYILLVWLFHTFPFCPLSTVSLSRKLFLFVLYLLFWFVILIIATPPTPLSFRCSCILYLVDLSRLLLHNDGIQITQGILWGILTTPGLVIVPNLFKISFLLLL